MSQLGRIFKDKIGMIVLLAIIVGMIGVQLVNAAPIYKSNELIPVDFIDYNYCTGEEMSVQGVVHIVELLVCNDNNCTEKYHMNYDAVVTGLTTGELYELTAVFKEAGKYSMDAALVYDLTMMVKITAENGCKETLQEDKFHITINANGEITVEHYTTKAECSEECY